MLPIAVLAGGLGSRLGLLSKEVPKCLLDINGKPFVYWQIELLKSAGYLNFIFCVSHKSKQIQDYLGDGSNWGINIQYSFDGETQVGTGGAIRKALPLLGDQFAVIYGDSYLPIDYHAVEDQFIDSNCEALMTVFRNMNQYDMSNVEFINGKVVNYNKESHTSQMHFIDYGLTYFHKSVFDDYLNLESFDLGFVCSCLSKSGKLMGFEVKERFYEVGSISGISEFLNHIRKVNE